MDRCKKCKKYVPSHILGESKLCDDCRKLKSGKPKNHEW